MPRVRRRPGRPGHSLLIRLKDRLDGDQARLLHHFIEVGEYGLAMEEIEGTLAQDAIPGSGLTRPGLAL